MRRRVCTWPINPRLAATWASNRSSSNLPPSTPLDTLLAVIEAQNRDPSVHGILVQLPLPRHLPVNAVLERIAVEKDVDGFHLYNVGSLALGTAVFPPCTPYGVQKLLEAEGIPIAGQNVVVVGASNIVGKPTAMMLMQKDATVCICHAKTRDLAQFTILADILVVAAGKPNLIVPQMVKTGAVVIDVGINRLPNGKIVGDVDFAGVSQKASYITPVPGGVGPMTVTMLLANTITAAQRMWGEPRTEALKPEYARSFCPRCARRRDRSPSQASKVSEQMKCVGVDLHRLRARNFIFQSPRS